MSIRAKSHQYQLTPPSLTKEAQIAGCGKPQENVSREDCQNSCASAPAAPRRNCDNAGKRVQLYALTKGPAQSPSHSKPAAMGRVGGRWVRTAPWRVRFAGGRPLWPPPRGRRGRRERPRVSAYPYVGVVVHLHPTACKFPRPLTQLEIPAEACLQGLSR